ncbi:MAG: proline--tRNA ligase [Treponema sp.]|nr:proline--tRNA ligase [Candidatus Treponema caballi]
MKASQTIISTLRDAPNDAVIASHQLMMRAGLIRKLGNGLYSYMPIGLRAFRKVENIIRQELDNVGMLEMKPTVIQPGEIWKESGRWDKMGAEMLKPQNRGGQDMVVSPTAEEAFTALVRDSLTSYKQLPFTLYQINTKYRDEIRPRYGVMRGREFTMMDAYSFDRDQASLDESYEKAAVAYRAAFKRMGLSTISVKADTGAMGGSGSEEFMVESEVGDDTLILCPGCKYAANVEKASCKPDVALGADGKPQVATDKAVEEIPTPDVKTIEQLTEFLKTTPQAFIKTLIYRVENAGVDLGKEKKFVAVCIRGDLDVNEAKLCALLKASEVELAEEADVIRITDAPVGFAGPVKMTKASVICDNSVMTMHDAVTGGLKKDIHFIHVEPGRDFTPLMTADVRTVQPGDICPECGGTFYSKKGNELGHIFKLGDKYTKSMNVTYLDENGKLSTPIMGCYGIGVDRTLASIIEGHHDDNGICWPMSVAPYQIAVVPVKYDGVMKETADKLYDELTKLGLEVLLDDRNERPGVKFKDMDLLGIPLRIVVGEKNLPNVEMKLRTASDAELVPATDAAERAAAIVQKALAELNA